MQKMYRAGAAFAVMVVACALQACGQKSASPVPTPTPSATATPTQTILVPGTTNQYSGTETQVITFASPTVTTPNSSASYTIADTETISTAVTGAAAPFDVHRALLYTTLTQAKYGVALATNTTDDFENVTASGGSQVLTLTQTVSSVTGTNRSSELANGGTGAYTSSTTTNYSPNETLATYPLVSGTSFAQTQARTVAADDSTVAASGTLSDSLTTTYQVDDSFTEMGTITNGDTTNVAENSDGSGTVTDAGPTAEIGQIGVPTNASGTYVIPITLNGTPYTIADYYPGNALAPSPLGIDTITVVGTPSSLPAGCPSTSTFPNLAEYDSSSKLLDTIVGTYTTESIRTFDSNGLTVCRTAATTVTVYSLQTGALKETNVTNVMTVLESSSASEGSKRRIPALHGAAPSAKAM
jgi:hypothetical protein